MRIEITRVIAAPVELVFKTVADIEHFSQALPHIVKVEFLSEVKCGSGTRFRETRLRQGKEVITELEVKEYVENERVRLVADSHGTLWNTLFSVKAKADFTELTLRMEGSAYKWLPRLTNPLISGMVKKAIEHDMDAVKSYCENKTRR